MGQFGDRSQLTHPQPHDGTSLTSSNDVLRPKERQILVSEQEDIGCATSKTGTLEPHTEPQVLNASRSRHPHTAASERAVAMNLQGAHIAGNNTRLTNVKGDYVTNTVNNYGETNGLEKLENFVSFEAQFDSSIQDPDRRCHPGTRKNVLKRLLNWVDNPNPTDRIFWLHGPAGAGKSAIAQTIARSRARPKVAASFFFFRSDIKRNDGNRLFTTLAYQLVLSIPEIRDHIVHSLSERPDLPRTDAETQFKQLLVRPFQVLPEDGSQPLAPAVYPIIDIVKKYRELAPVIIIDGVDECIDDSLQQRFLQVIGDAVRDYHLPLRFLIVSRPELHIEQTIRRFQPPTLTIDLAKLDDANQDIKKYLVEKFSYIASEQGLDPAWPGENIIDEIVYKSSGNFIFPSLVIRFVGDPDNIAESQLDIVLNIKPPTTTTPFAILDQLFLEILRRVPDQDFLKRYLALLVSRISASIGYGDDAVLMHVSEKELHAKLRRMRSLLNLERGINLHHRSFLDFLHDSSRSSHYYIQKQEGIRGYLEVIVDSLVRYISVMIAQPDRHNSPHFVLRFREMVKSYPPKIELPVKEWQEVVQPLLDLQAKLLQLPNFSTWNCLRCDECTAFHLMRELSQQAVLQELSGVASVDASKVIRNLQTSRSVISPIATKTAKSMDNDLDSILLALFTLLPETMENYSPEEGVINLMDAILHFEYAETVTRIRSVLDAHKLVYLLTYMIHSKHALHRDAKCKASLLASEIFTKVSIVFLPYFSNGNDKPIRYTLHGNSHIEILSQTIFVSKILDPHYIVPVFGLMKDSWGTFLISGNGDFLSMKRWRSRCSVTVIQVMLRLAKAIQYLHLMGVVLYHEFYSDNVFLDSNLCPRICCLCSTSRSLLDKECQKWFSLDDNIFSFGCLFYEMYAGAGIWPDKSIDSRKRIIKKRPSEPEIPEYVWQLIQRCSAENPKSRPTIDAVVKEMKGWHSVGHVGPDEAVGGHNVGHVEPDEVVNKVEVECGHSVGCVVNGAQGWDSVGQALNGVEDWHTARQELLPQARQDRTYFQALGSVISDLRRNLC